MSLDMRATILVAALSRAHNPTRSWWADTQHDRAAFRAALAERLPHLPLTDFGRRAGQGITAPDVQVYRTRVPGVESDT